MILIPAGSFLMGSDEFEREGPVREVDLAAFLMDRYPVTNADYEHFVRAVGHRAPVDWGGGAAPADRLDHPVAVTWTRAAGTARRRPTADSTSCAAARGSSPRSTPAVDYYGESVCVTGISDQKCGYVYDLGLTVQKTDGTILHDQYTMDLPIGGGTSGAPAYRNYPAATMMGMFWGGVGNIAVWSHQQNIVNKVGGEVYDTP